MKPSRSFTPLMLLLMSATIWAACGLFEIDPSPKAAAGSATGSGGSMTSSSASQGGGGEIGVGGMGGTDAGPPDPFTCPLNGGKAVIYQEIAHSEMDAKAGDDDIPTLTLKLMSCGNPSLAEIIISVIALAPELNDYDLSPPLYCEGTCTIPEQYDFYNASVRADTGEIISGSFVGMYSVVNPDLTPPNNKYTVGTCPIVQTLPEGKPVILVFQLNLRDPLPAPEAMNRTFQTHIFGMNFSTGDTVERIVLPQLFNDYDVGVRIAP